MAVPFAATYRISLANDGEARVVAESLRVEAGDPLPKAMVSVVATGRDVTIRVEAEDASALRAATKSFLSWAKGAVQSMRSARGPAPPPL